MDNFNRQQKLYCKYCRKECKSLNSLKQHEIRCDKNQNKIICGNKGKIKGYKWLTDGINQIFVSPDKFDEYLNWELGRIRTLISTGSQPGQFNHYLTNSMLKSM